MSGHIAHSRRGLANNSDFDVPAAMIASEMRIKRAAYRANHRGTKELDIILGRFAGAELSGMSEIELGAFEALLALPDPQIDAWIKGAEASPEMVGLIGRIRRHHGLED
jgi:antitoxin CptB